MSGYRWRSHLESAFVLDLRRMVRRGVVTPGVRTSGTWQWAIDGTRIASIGFDADLGVDSGLLALNYTHAEELGNQRNPVQCKIQLSTMPLHYGGRRWYMHCPYTGRRAVRLFKFSGVDHFCHRTAIWPPPTYSSQRVSRCDRIMAQRWAIRHKLGDTFGDLFSYPHKPKWMRLSTFERYAARDPELAVREAVYSDRLLGRLGTYPKG